VKLSVSLKDVSQNPIPGEFSIAVTNQEAIQGNEDGEDIDVSMNVFSSLHNWDHKQDLNDRLIGWSGFYPWQKMLMASTPLTPEFPLRSRVYKRGKAFFKTSGQPVPDSTVINVYLQNSLAGYETVTGPEGRFDLIFLFDFYDVDELFYSAKYRGKLIGDVTITLQEDTIAGTPFMPWKESAMPDGYAESRLKINQIKNSYNFFNSPTKKIATATPNLNEKFEDEFMGADISVNVEDYIILPTMEDLIREVVPSLGIRRFKNTIAVRVLFSVKSVISAGDPLYVIDGVMTRNSNLFLSLSPKDVLTVKVENDLNKLSRLGALGENGIVYVQTKKQSTVEQIRNQNTTLPIQGLNKPVISVWPEYGSNITWRNPDFRFTDYWNPSIKTNAQGNANVSFYTGDDVGKMNILIEGFMANGQPFSRIKELNVKFYQSIPNK